MQPYENIKCSILILLYRPQIHTNSGSNEEDDGTPIKARCRTVSIEVFYIGRNLEVLANEYSQLICTSNLFDEHVIV